MRKFYIFLALIFLSSCASTEYSFCPNVVIPRETGYLRQIVNSRQEFNVEITGFEGYCYYDESIGRNKAVIKPIFSISRVAPSDQSDVDFSYFIKLPEGPGVNIDKYSLPQSVSMEFSEKRKEVYGRETTVKLPMTNLEEFKITLGLNITKQEHYYNNKTFDIKHDYFEKKIAKPCGKAKSGCGSCDVK